MYISCNVSLLLINVTDNNSLSLIPFDTLYLLFSLSISLSHSLSLSP